MSVVRFDAGSTDDARHASSNGTATSATGSARARSASRRQSGVRSTIVVSRLSTTVVAAARTHSASTGTSRRRRLSATATASKNPSRSMSTASGTPASRKPSAGAIEVSWSPTRVIRGRPYPAGSVGYLRA